VSQTERPDLDAQIDALYGLPLGAFTAERDALAKRLRKEGDREGAAAVKALGKPSAAAWLVNQLARRHGGEVGELLAAGAALRRAHEAALAGGGAPALTAAAEGERRTVGRLLERVRELEAEGAPSEATLARVRETLHAAASDEEARDLVGRGRLVRERRAMGLGPLAFAGSTPAPASPPARPAERRPEPSRRDAAEERDHARRLREAQRAVEAARREAEAARAAHEEREEDHLRAREAREAAEGERERARQAVRRAEDAVDAARAAEAEARALAREERRRHDSAAAALLAAENEARRLEGGRG
jgi:hypothetical protein